MAERDNQERQQQLVQLAEALLAAGSVAALAAEIAAVLVVPMAVALAVAEIAIVEVPGVSGSGFIRRVGEENLIYRAAYISAAVRRLRGAGDVGNQTALALEYHYFKLHQAQEIRRQVGGGQVAEALERYGTTLGWYATIRPTNRPNHRAAHEKNWYPLLGPPVLTQAYPGVLPHCLCEVGPPIDGATAIR